ncbi:MAG TPA: zf-TFIIB domain-containing protein [Kofleriaceae bacterium]
MRCPSCKTALVQAGRTWKCASCDGAWVESDVLVPMLEQSASTLVELAWQPSGEAHVRACPQCTEAMQTVQLGTVALDRCESHGVWFDARELAALLKQAKRFRAEDKHEHRGILETLGRVLG